jgi:hypothetical protein
VVRGSRKSAGTNAFIMLRTTITVINIFARFRAELITYWLLEMLHAKILKIIWVFFRTKQASSIVEREK